MAYCGPRGIPHHTFRGWPPLSQALALAWQAREGERCSTCGIHPSLTDPEQGGDPNALVLRGWLCRTCEIAESQDKNAPERIPGEHRHWVPALQVAMDRPDDI